jgi:hypothetical protein
MLVRHGVAVAALTERTGMARKPNYRFERMEREKAKAAKKAARAKAREEKAEKRKAEKAEQAMAEELSPDAPGVRDPGPG